MIKTAKNSETKLTRLVDVLRTTPAGSVVSWTLGREVEFDAAGNGIGPVRGWVLCTTSEDPDLDDIRRIKARPRELSKGAVMLATWMRENGLTQRELANRLFKEASTINKWLHFKVTPGPVTLVRLQELTGIPKEAW